MDDDSVRHVGIGRSLWHLNLQFPEFAEDGTFH
jgi:hypothetical protein